MEMLNLPLVMSCVLKRVGWEAPIRGLMSQKLRGVHKVKAFCFLRSVTRQGRPEKLLKMDKSRFKHKVLTFALGPGSRANQSDTCCIYCCIRDESASVNHVTCLLLGNRAPRKGFLGEQAHKNSKQ